MRTIRRFLAASGFPAYCLLLAGFYACTPSLSENNTATGPLYEMPNDGLAEVARYSYSRLHDGVPSSGTATLIVVREHLNRLSYVKTNRLKQRIPAIKIMLMKTLPSVNWDHRDNLAMYCRTNLRPVRLAMTAEEWCGNNYLEWTARGDEVTMLGRPYTDDLGRMATQVAVKAGYYLYEQLPVLVRALAKSTQSLVLRLIAPQSAYLLPHTNELQVEMQRSGMERIKTAAGEFSTIVVTVKAEGASEYFPKPERYWVDEQRHFIVKAERNEAGIEAGQLHVNFATYELQDVRRIPYWKLAAPPATSSLADRQRATYSSWLNLNIAENFAAKQNPKFMPEDIAQSFGEHPLPAEFLSDPAGNNRLSKTYDGTGGWWFKEATGRFELNYPIKPSSGLALQD